jgi:hypothetical protein
MVLAHPLVCGFSALGAEKPHTFEMKSTALPKAQSANCVNPISVLVRLFRSQEKQTNKNKRKIKYRCEN